MAAKTRPARVIQFAEIEQRFQLVPMTLGLGAFYPAVTRKDDRPDRYSVRVLKSVNGRTYNYDYFKFDSEGTITAAPRGFARDYRPGRVPVEELDAAVARFAEAVAL